MLNSSTHRKNSALSIKESRNKPLPPIIVDSTPGSRQSIESTQSAQIHGIPSSGNSTPVKESPGSYAPPAGSPGLFQPKTLKRRNLKKLTLNSNGADDYNNGPNNLNHIGLSSPALSTPGSTTSKKNEDLEFVESFEKLTMSINHKLDLKQKDILNLKKLGEGQSGLVSKVLHVPTNMIMAKKQINFEKSFKVQNQVLRELKILNEVQSPFIIEFHGAIFLDNSKSSTSSISTASVSKENITTSASQNTTNDNKNNNNDNHNDKYIATGETKVIHTEDGPVFNFNGVSIFLEYMDCGSLDSILNKLGRIKEVYLSKISYNVLEGLNYLYSKHKIIHRDIKPSNVLLNSKGEIKICDFGVSRELNNNSIADTFVGTSTYMSPERIQGDVYSIKGDVWSIGLMLIELSTGEFPFGKKDTPNGILDLLQRIVNEDPPTLPRDKYSDELCDFIDLCLKKQKDRPTPNEFLNMDDCFIYKYKYEDGTRLLRHLAKKLRK